MREGDDLIAEPWTITRKDSVERVLEVSTSVFSTVSGVAHVLGLMQDVTERNRAQESLKKAHESLAAMLKSLCGRYDALFETPFPYSMGWYPRPVRPAGSGWRLHAVFLPLLGFSVIYLFHKRGRQGLTPESHVRVLSWICSVVSVVR